MTAVAVVALALLIPTMTGLAWYLGRALQRLGQHGEPLSPVSRQHFELLQTGRLNEGAVEAAKDRFRDLLESGRERAVEASLRAGTQYVYQVRALAELGTDAAGRILERQLQRRLSDDRLEQSWYWVDVASSLRSLNRDESLPHLLRCADAALDAPLGHFYAAETICFFGFSSYARQGATPAGRCALRLLRRAMEGLRHGVSPHVVGEARLGELIESFWDDRPDEPSPLLVRVLAESLRLLRRTSHAAAAFGDEHGEHETFDWQLSRLAVLEPAIREYLGSVPQVLTARLPRAGQAERTDILLALEELRVDVSDALLPMLKSPGFQPLDLAVDVLRWSRNPDVATWLRAQVGANVPMTRRATKRPRATPPRRPSLPATVPYRSVLRALRSHPSAEAEELLLLACRDWDPTFRLTAFGSLGWWEPVMRHEVLDCLKAGRRDPSAEVRQAARAALARLGERTSLQWFRQALHGENAHNQFAAVQVIAAEGLTLLWPELDRLADADNPDLALHTREALERLAEEMDWQG